MENDDKEKRVLYILDDITDKLYEECITPLLEMDKDGEPITLYVNTCGGDLHAAMCLCEVLDRVQSQVDVFLLSEVYSAGMFIAMAGADNDNVTVYAYPSTRGLIHWGTVSFGEDTVENVYDYYAFHRDKIQSARVAYILTHSTYTAEEIAGFDRRDYWVDAQEMLERGIVDVIL